MSRSRTPILALLALSVAASFSAVAAGSSSRSAAIPSCPKSISYGINPHPACIWHTFVSDSYVSHMSLTADLTSPPKPVKGYFDAFTVTMHYTDDMKNVCPAQGVPSSLIPCRFVGAPISLMGAYVKGEKALTGPAISENDTKSCGNGVYGPCCPDVGTCVLHFQVNAVVSYGHFALVFRIMHGDVTNHPGNDLGQTGAEAVVSVTVPRKKP